MGFTETFEWKTHAVSIRLARRPETLQAPGAQPSKYNLQNMCTQDQWYIEDPFDLKHNLASNCTALARARILEKMRETHIAMTRPNVAAMDAFQGICPKGSKPRHYFLKCRVHTDKVSLSDFLAFFKDVPVETVFWPGFFSNSGRTEAFLRFENELDRKAAHTKNETYVGSWQLRLLVCSAHALEDARSEPGARFEEIEGNKKNLPSVVIAADQTSASPETMKSLASDNQEDQAANVRDGLRKAESIEEVSVLVQRAKALGLKHEANLGEGKLKSLKKEKVSRSIQPRHRTLMTRRRSFNSSERGGVRTGLLAALSPP